MAAKPKFVESAPRPFIPCCFDGCTNNANVRVWTKTGWANVCARVDRADTVNTYHYERIETVPRVTHNLVMDELRAKRRRPGVNEKKEFRDGMSVDELQEYIEELDYDAEDIKHLISPTLIGKLEAEASKRGMLKAKHRTVDISDMFV